MSAICPNARGAVKTKRRVFWDTKSFSFSTSSNRPPLNCATQPFSATFWLRLRRRQNGNYDVIAEKLKCSPMENEVWGRGMYVCLCYVQLLLSHEPLLVGGKALTSIWLWRKTKIDNFIAFVCRTLLVATKCPRSHFGKFSLLRRLARMLWHIAPQIAKQ